MSGIGDDKIEQATEVPAVESDRKLDAQENPIEDPGDELDYEKISEDSTRYIENWQQLVSQTNWEKGKIICQWRESVCKLHPEIESVSDRAWSQLIGNVSSEHVGRLRRTFQRFGETHTNYDNLSWTHFMVATAWDDAEMWLEGAVQNGWTIDSMRRTRWESMGARDTEIPRAEDVIVEEISVDGDQAVARGDGEVIEGPILEGPDWGESDQSSTSDHQADEDVIQGILDSAPEELVEAYQALTTAIESCREENWKGLSRRQAFKLINSLKNLVRK